MNHPIQNMIGVLITNRISIFLWVSAHPADAIPAFTPTPTCSASTPIVTAYVTTITTTSLVPRHCPSFYTQVDTPAPWSSCAFDTSTCTRLLCLSLKTITQPCITDACCTRTATDTVYANCPLSCPTGCATSWTVATASCPKARHTPTHY